MASPLHHLALPAELRLRIFSYYFSADMPGLSSPREWPVTGQTRLSRFLQGLRLLHVCQLFRREALQAFENSLEDEITLRLAAERELFQLADQSPCTITLTIDCMRAMQERKDATQRLQVWQQPRSQVIDFEATGLKSERDPFWSMYIDDEASINP